MNNNEHTDKIQARGVADDLEKGTSPPTPTATGKARRAGSRFRASAALTCSRVSFAMLLVAVSGAAVAAIWYFFGWLFVIQLVIVAAVAAFVAGGGFRFLYVVAMTAKRDLIALWRFAKLLFLVKRLQKRNASLGEIFSEHAARQPNKACFVFEDRIWTFKEVEEYSQRVANVFRSHGYHRGQVVALLLENRPEFVAIWLGLSRLGVVVPLINHNLKHAALLHSLTVAKCQALIFGSDLMDSVADIASILPSNLSLYRLGDSKEPNSLPQATPLDPLLAAVSPVSAVTKDAAGKPTARSEGFDHHDKLVYIYTSGTTGLPKAAVISHSRYVFIAGGIKYLADIRDSDVCYCPLPLYHTAGGVMSIGQALLFGSTVVIRKKFSASQYFPDCAKYKCTVGQYIGEMCRYVLAVPPGPHDTDHCLRVLFGNGLRPQIWPQFVERFKIPHIAEFYGATEGNANIVNVDNKPGSIGFVSRIIPSVYPISIIKADLVTGEPIRGPNGLCQICEPDEPGVFIGKIVKGNPSRAFLGYVDRAATDKKIVRDVFTKGDSAFLSGDLLVADELGYLFFKDRTGDTYRWKGENVSTSEVEAIVSNVAGYRDCVVYGVEVPNLEGRAGMAAILDTEHSLDIQALGEGLAKNLPVYSRPQFVRLLSSVDMTGTFKLKKLDLQKEGFGPSTMTDTLYYLTSKQKYELLTPEVYQQICTGKIRL